MPTSIKQNTLTICEVSYGPAKEAVLYFANRRKPHNVFTGNIFDKFKYYIQNPIEDDNWCERIEIRIPNPLLRVKKNFLRVYNKSNRVFYVYETIWHGRATISGKKLKKIKGFHFIKPCWHKSHSVSTERFFSWLPII